jgi:hypothetical protein
MRKVYFAPTRVWVGDTSQEATHQAVLPVVDDPRWTKGKPGVLDKTFLILTHSFPDGRLMVRTERERSQSLPRLGPPNERPFDDCLAWIDPEVLDKVVVPEHDTGRSPSFGP